MYNNNELHGMPDLIFCKILEWINKETPPGAIKNVIKNSTIRSYVRELNKVNPKNSITTENCRTLDNQPFLLFSVVIKDKPIYAFASPFMLQCIPECSIIGIDGTFYIAPKKFYQVCIFIGRTSVMNMPLLYLALPNKKEITYVTAFRFFLDSIISNGIKFNQNLKFICDFELAEINSLKKVFMIDNNSLQLCYFHFCKSLKERMCLIFTEKFCNFTQSLFEIFILLPLINIESAKKFISFLPKIKNFSDQSNQFVNYFISNYTLRYPIELWNITGKFLSHRCTNNANESFNKKINSHLCKNPTVLNFYNVVVNMENDYRNKYHNLKGNMENINPKYFNEPVHDENFRFCECIDVLYEYPIFKRNLNSSDKYFGVFDNIEFFDITINIPKYEKVQNSWNKIQ